MTLKALKEVVFPEQSQEKTGPMYSYTPLYAKARDKYLEELFNEQRRILGIKSNDYAGEDLLSNFRLAGMITNQTSKCPDAINCLNMIGNKVARLGQLLNTDKSVQNESVQDSVIDLANYTALLYMILKMHK